MFTVQCTLYLSAVVKVVLSLLCTVDPVHGQADHRVHEAVARLRLP